MENTLQIGDRVLVNKVVYHFRDIARGDVIVFSGQDSWGPDAPPPPSNPLVRGFDDVLSGLGLHSDQTYYIKRVIGLPGDRVACCDAQGRVTVNGVALNESQYVYPGEQPSAVKFNNVVPAGHLWVMGDHRGDSEDSRYHPDDPGGGSIPESQVVGRAFFIIWPPSQFRDLPIPNTFQQASLHAGAAGARRARGRRDRAERRGRRPGGRSGRDRGRHRDALSCCDAGAGAPGASAPGVSAKLDSVSEGAEMSGAGRGGRQARTQAPGPAQRGRCRRPPRTRPQPRAPLRRGREHGAGERRAGRDGLWRRPQGGPQAAAQALVLARVPRPGRRRAAARGGHQDVRDPGLLHPVRVDGEHARDQRPGPGQQARLRRPRHSPRRHRGLQRRRLLGPGTGPGGHELRGEVRRRLCQHVRLRAPGRHPHQAGHRPARGPRGLL